MSENIFFDRNALKSCGKDVIIGKTVRIRHPELVEIGDHVIIDDFTYISTALTLSSYVHIASGVSIIGGTEAHVFMDSFSTLAPHVTLASGSDDYIAGIATPLIPEEWKGNPIIGNIKIGRHSIVGAGSVVLPNVIFGEGAAVGALSLVKSDLSPWKLYGGIPARFLKNRDKDAILRLEKDFLEKGGI
jgi:galactoside O-acetyltransferase